MQLRFNEINQGKNIYIKNIINDFLIFIYKIHILTILFNIITVF